MEIVVLDTCVFYPIYLRDLLLDAADTDHFAVKWSEETLEELERNLALRLPPARARLLIDALRASFADALVPRTAYAQLLPHLQTHPKDRHVLAAAVVGGATVIVTENLKDFPTDALGPYGIRAESADHFVSSVFDGDYARLLEIVQQAATRYYKPPMTSEAPLDRLERHIPTTVARLRVVLSDD